MSEVQIKIYTLQKFSKILYKSTLHPTYPILSMLVDHLPIDIPDWQNVS
jgi:hypothetical protein